jgi:hypothetical protein
VAIGKALFELGESEVEGVQYMRFGLLMARRAMHPNFEPAWLEHHWQGIGNWTK